MRRYGALAGVVALGVAAALVLLVGRWRLERQDRTVEVILDGPAWQELAVREGWSPAALFTALRVRGATSLAVYERTLRTLQRHGRLAYLGGGDLLAASRAEVLAPPLRELVAAGAVRPEAVYVIADPALRPWLLEAFRGILGPSRVRLRGPVVEVVGSRDDLEDLGLGFLPADLAAAKRAGLSVVLRPRNYRGLTSAGLAWKLAAMQRLVPGATLVFDGADVLGYERLVGEAARGLQAGGYRVARIEVFTVRRKQRGEDALTALMRPAVLRLFSLTPEEMATLSPAAIVEKFRRAPLERNIRLLYLRPLTNTPGGVDAIPTNLDLVGRIAGRVQGLGFALGRPRPLPDLQPGLLPLVLVAAGALGLGAIALWEISAAAGIPLRPASLWLLVAAGVVLTAAAALSGDGFLLLWRRLLALGAAVAGATLAVHVALARGGGGPLRRGLAALWLASGISAAAGVLVAGLLSGWSFMLAVHVFVGVKAAHVLPPLLVGFLLAFGGEAGAPRSTAQRIWRWLERPLRLQYAVVTVLVAVAAVLLLFRSGNFGLPVFGPEVRLRQALEDLLVARPRTKEFLIGHPALMLAAGAAAVRLRAWVVPLAMVGVVGQAGLINSFSHIHTPLVVVVLRTLYALLIGSVVGSAALLVLQYLLRRAVSGAAIRPAAPAAPAADD